MIRRVVPVCVELLSTLKSKDPMLEMIQWPAMVVTLVASWCVASKKDSKRHLGFWLFLASNALWIVWGIHTSAYALVALQIGLAAMNIRGANKTDET